MTDVRRAVQNYKQQFAGGMIPFDSAYITAKKVGHTEAEAVRLGVYAVLDALVAQYENPTDYVDMNGMPVEEPW